MLFQQKPKFILQFKFIYTIYINIIKKKLSLKFIMICLMKEELKFLYNSLRLFNSKNIIKIIAITNSVKRYLIKKHKVNKKNNYSPKCF